MAHETGDRGGLLPFEEDLSAFLDGELEAEREAEVRAELARNPALAARLEALAAVDARLRGGEAPAVPSDLHERLRARIAAGESAEHRTSETAAPRPTPLRGPARRRRWITAPLMTAAALAAGLALLLLMARPVADLPEERIAEGPGPEAPQAAPTPEFAPIPIDQAPRTPDEAVPVRSPAPTRLAEAPSPLDPVQTPSPLDPVELAETPPALDPVELAETPPALDPVELAETPPALDPVELAETPPALDPVELAEIPTEIEAIDIDAASDEEIELAMEWELLEDMELIDELDLLEAMVRRAARGQG